MNADHAEQVLGRTIRLERERLGISQEQLALDAELHRTYIGSIERGERNVSLKNIIKISAALNLRAAELLHKSGL
jgi:transcriptional regulator with XRE-family HTH domain